MRRPTPLPPPPARDPAPDEGAGTDDIELLIAARRPIPGDGALPAGFSETEPILPSSTPEPIVTPESGGSADAGPGAAEVPSAVNARDVWAAARARRRALRAEVRRFTARQRHRRTVWIVAVSAVLLLVLGSVGAAYSPLLSVDRVRVVGTSELSPDAVEAALAGQVGRPLPLVDSSEVKAALIAFPLVESYTLEARPPHELVVRIVERTPIGTVKSAAGYTLVDAAGVALSTTPKRPKGYPAISVPGGLTGVTSKTFTAVGTVYRSLPDDIREQVTAMSATTPHDVTLTLGKTDTDIVWGDASQSARKAVVLASVMVSEPPSEVSRYDVSSPEAVVVR